MDESDFLQTIIEKLARLSYERTPAIGIITGADAWRRVIASRSSIGWPLDSLMAERPTICDVNVAFHKDPKMALSIFTDRKAFAEAIEGSQPA